MERIFFKHLHAATYINNPVCTVCIANYNGMEIIDDCISSIYQQNFNLPIEIIVHDDASTDDSVNFIRTKYPNVELLISEKNSGFCIGNNRMVNIARGEFILLLNNDATLHQDALKTLYEFSKSQKPKGILGLPEYRMETGEVVNRGYIFDPFLNPFPNFNVKKKKVGLVTGACLWIPKVLWDDLGGFPEWFETLNEDVYLCCYARLHGYPVEVLQKSGFNHWLGKTLGGGKFTDNRLTSTLKRRMLTEQNKSYVMLMCYPTIILIILIPLHLLFLVVEGLTLTVIKREGILWKSIYWNCLKELWINKKLWYAQRRKVQSNKTISALLFFRPFKILPYKLYMLAKYGIPKVEIHS